MQNEVLRYDYTRERPNPSEADRARRLAEAGYNVRNLNGADVALDLLSDVPHRPLIESHVDGLGWSDLREPPLEEAAAAIYGPARFVVTSHGRAAELALATALTATRPEKRPLRVLSTILFPTLRHALLACGATIEVAPAAAMEPRTSEIALDWVRERLAKDPFDIVYLEPANNGIGGLPVRPAYLRALREITQKHGVLIGLDATRLVSNAALLEGPILETTRAIADAVDVMCLSCGKEGNVPNGGLVVVKSLELQQQAFDAVFNMGLAHEPLTARIQLTQGLSLTARYPEVTRDRRRLLDELAELLRSRAVPFLEPIGAHALYVPVTKLLRPEAANAVVEVEAALYLGSGIRAKSSKQEHLGENCLRVTWPLAAMTRDDVPRIADAFARLFTGAREHLPVLRPTTEACIHPLTRRYERVQ